MGTENDPATPAPAPAETSPQEQPAPKFMTAEEFNGAMTARDRRLMRQIDQQLEKIRSSLANPSAPPAEEVMEGEGEPHADPAESPMPLSKRRAAEMETRKLSAQVSQLKKQMAAKDEATAKEKTELLQRQERTDAISALTEAGSHNAKGAYLVLRDEGRIKRNEAGDLVMVVKRDYGDEEMSLAVGIKEWLATTEGSHYMPPRGGGDGSGTVIKSGAPRNGAKLSKEELKRDAINTVNSFILGGR